MENAALGRPPQCACAGKVESCPATYFYRPDTGIPGKRRLGAGPYDMRNSSGLNRSRAQVEPLPGHLGGHGHQKLILLSGSELHVSEPPGFRQGIVGEPIEDRQYLLAQEPTVLGDDP